MRTLEMNEVVLVSGGDVLGGVVGVIPGATVALGAMEVGAALGVAACINPVGAVVIGVAVAGGALGFAIGHFVTD